MLGRGQHRQHGAAVSVDAQAPPSAEDAIAVLPQDLEVAISICIELSRWIQLPTPSLADQGFAGLGRTCDLTRPAGQPQLRSSSLARTARFDNFGRVVQAID
jgi:hypothetical protein